MSFRYVTYTDMRRATIVFCLVGITILLSAAIACGQVAVVITNAGATVIDKSGSVQTVSGRNLIDLRSPTPDPGPGPDPGPPGTLAEKIGMWSAAVGEPKVAAQLSANATALADAMKGSSLSWAQAKTGLEAFNILVLSPTFGESQKAEQWRSVFARVKAELDTLPASKQNEATMRQVAAGYSAGAGAVEQQAIGPVFQCLIRALLQCILTGGATDDAKPKPIPMPGVSTAPRKPTIAGDISKVYPPIRIPAKPLMEIVDQKVELENSVRELKEQADATKKRIDVLKAKQAVLDQELAHIDSHPISKLKSVLRRVTSR